MSCWVTPEIAAEWWSISVDQVYQGVADGSIASKQDLGRLFIDVAPDSPQLVRAQEDTNDSLSWKIGRAEASQRRQKLAA